MIDVKATASGEKSLDKEIDAETREIRKEAEKALHNVGAEMIKSLQKHIKEDWYLPWGAPKRYIRRTDSGVPNALGDTTNMSVEVKGNKLAFEYSPRPNPVGYAISGDKLIDIIQTAGWKTLRPSVDTQGRMVMPRPFWDKFVNEQIHGGIMDAFIAGMQKHKVIADEVNIKVDVVYDPITIR